MTAARQERKPPHSRAYLCEILAAWALVSAIASTSVGAATTELVVVNRYTGLAIDGFDPVAYFVDALPREGRAPNGVALRRRDLAFPERRQPLGICRHSRRLHTALRRP